MFRLLVRTSGELCRIQQFNGVGSVLSAVYGSVNPDQQNEHKGRRHRSDPPKLQAGLRRGQTQSHRYGTMVLFIHNKPVRHQREKTARNFPETLDGFQFTSVSHTSADGCSADEFCCFVHRVSRFSVTMAPPAPGNVHLYTHTHIICAGRLQTDCSVLKDGETSVLSLSVRYREREAAERLPASRVSFSQTGTCCGLAQVTSLLLSGLKLETFLSVKCLCPKRLLQT